MLVTSVTNIVIVLFCLVLVQLPRLVLESIKNSKSPFSGHQKGPWLSPPHYHLFWGKVVLGFRNFGYDFKGLAEMFEGDSADMCTIQISNCVHGVRRPGSEDPHRHYCSNKHFS
jgi:hypothetical protein